MSLHLKKQINKELKDAGFAGMVDISAINKLADYVQQQGRLEAIQEIVKLCQSDANQGGRITSESVDMALSQLCGTSKAAEMIAVISAFDVPKISYDPVGRKLYADHRPRSLLAGAESKQRLYTDRLYLIHQRMRRNSTFQQGNQIMHGASDVQTAQLTDLQSLKGVVGKARIVMGCISRSDRVGSSGQQQYMLEDMTSAVPLDISGAETTSGFFTENCIVIAEGYLGNDGVFHAHALGFPPTEPRNELPLAAKKLNFFGGPPLSRDEHNLIEEEELSHSQDRVVILANVWLDKQEVKDGLNTLFSSFSEVVQVPAMFVLMGNFHSRALSATAASGCDDSIDFLEMRDHFNSLAALIEQYPRIKEFSRFVFMPGPGDPGLGCILPQAPLPAYFTAELRRVVPNAVFATNPCRLRYFSQQVVLFRYDALKRLRRRCIIPPNRGPGGGATQAAGATQGGGGGAAAAVGAGGAGDDEGDMFGHLALTLLQQSHLCPLPLLLQPIFWEADHALHLYPLPHSVVVADASPQAQYTHEGCNVFNPGSFSEGLFAAYMPCTSKVEMSELPRDDADPGQDEFGDEDGNANEDEDEEEPMLGTNDMLG